MAIVMWLSCLKYGLIEGILEWVVMKKLGINVGFKVGIGCNFLWIRAFWVVFKLSDNLFYIVIEGYFSGMSKWLSKWFIELCGDFVQFWGDETSGGEVMKWQVSVRWIFSGMCEWNAYPGIGSGRIKTKCKIPPS